MKIKQPLLLLLFFLVGACTAKDTSPTNSESQLLQQAITQLNVLQKERNTQQSIRLIKQTLTQAVQIAEHAQQKDSVIHHIHQLLNICQYTYQPPRLVKEGIQYMDSLSQNPFLQKHCQHELWSSLANLHQLIGENQEAVRLADKYLLLPPHPNAYQFIRQAEIISGVYVYSGNDLAKAISILEKAMKVYREGGKYENMVQLISRLGIYYHLQGDYEKAVATNQEAIASYNDSMPPRNVVIAYGEQANLYAELGMYSQALLMNQKAQYYSMKKDSFGLGDLYRYRATIFREMGQKDSLFHYLDLGERASAMQNSYKGVFINKVLKTDVYLDYPDSTQKALQLALSICPDSTRVPQWAKYQLMLHLGRAFLKTGQEQKGIQLMEQATQSLTETNMMEAHSASKTLMDYYLSKGMDAAFVRSYTRNETIADSLKNIEKIRAVASAKIRFDTQRKEEENTMLAAQVKWQQQQLFYNVCISIILLMLLIASVAYLIARKKANKQLVESNKHKIEELIKHQQELNRHNEQLSEQIEQAVASDNLNNIRHLTGQNLLSREDEKTFRQSFAAIHPSYLPTLRIHYPQLTRNEELLAMLICMNQSTDEIALIMGINRNSVNVVRSRMRKNMELTKEDSLDKVLKQYMD